MLRMRLMGSWRARVWRRKGLSVGLRSWKLRVTVRVRMRGECGIRWRQQRMRWRSGGQWRRSVRCVCGRGALRVLCACCGGAPLGCALHGGVLVLYERCGVMRLRGGVLVCLLGGVWGV